MDNYSSGNYIRKKLNQLGMTQEQLAEAIELSSKSISNWMSGKSQIKKENAEKVAEVLGVSYLEILAGRDLNELDEKTKKHIDLQIKGLSEKIGDVENVTITIEGQGILSLETAQSALGIAIIALALGIWAVFSHTTLNLILCILLGVIGIVFLIFGRWIIRKLERRLRKRKKMSQ